MSRIDWDMTPYSDTKYWIEKIYGDTNQRKHLRDVVSSFSVLSGHMVQEWSAGHEPASFSKKISGLAEIILVSHEYSPAKSAIDWKNAGIKCSILARLISQSEDDSCNDSDVVAMKLAQAESAVSIHVLELSLGLKLLNSKRPKQVTKQGSWAATTKPDGSKLWHHDRSDENPVVGTLKEIATIVDMDQRTLKRIHESGDAWIRRFTPKHGTNRQIFQAWFKEGNHEYLARVAQMSRDRQ